MYVPPQVVTNEMLGRIMDTTDEWIVPRTGIKERRFVEPGVGSAEIGAKAAEAALADAGLTADDVDFIIFATMTPDHYLPGNGGLLARRPGMKTTHALDIRMQCPGFLSGLQTADAVLPPGLSARVPSPPPDFPPPGRAWVRGCVVGYADEVDLESALEDLDPLEGVEDGLFSREILPVVLDGGLGYRAWVYLFHVERLPTLQRDAVELSGEDWASYLE